MAIVQISQIQHRRGLYQDLPQLASGELGWALDQRRLFIGNGTPEEGAPLVGNTEILTVNSDILATLDTYTYRGSAAGYEVQTGPSLLAPIVRPVQAKLDDFVTARDFGAVGDGAEDDSMALNRAIYELYLPESSSEARTRRVLDIPPGTYRFNAQALRIMRNVKLRGAGKDRTIIVQTNPSLPVVELADSRGQTGTGLTGIGTNGALLPGNVEVEGITFVHQVGGNIINIESAQNVVFKDSSFKSNQTNPILATPGNYSAVVLGSAIAAVENVRFVRCDFAQVKYVVNTSADAQFIEFLDCTFDQHHRAFSFGSSLVVTKPRYIKIINSKFTNIASCGIYAGDDVKGVFSSYNYFDNVGNNYTANPVDPVIAFREGNCYSVGDTFDRSLTDDAAVPTISYGPARITALNDLRGLSLGTYVIGHGNVRALAAGSLTPVSTGIALTPNIESAVMNYTIVRGSSKRTGQFRFTNGVIVSYDDDYVEDSDVGVDLSFVLDSGTPTLFYSSTAGNTPVLLINMEHFRTYDDTLPINYINLFDDIIYLNSDPLSLP